MVVQTFSGRAMGQIANTGKFNNATVCLVLERAEARFRGVSGHAQDGVNKTNSANSSRACRIFWGGSASGLARPSGRSFWADLWWGCRSAIRRGPPVGVFGEGLWWGCRTVMRETLSTRLSSGSAGKALDDPSGRSLCRGTLMGLPNGHGKGLCWGCVLPQDRVL